MNKTETGLSLSTKVIFIWHMHQPCYKHPDREGYILPWVRLHAVKDYYGMARIIQKCGKAKATFNFSGVLLDQLFDYAQRGAKDDYVNLTLKKASDLDSKEKEFIINRFFSVNFERFIRPNTRFSHLYDKKQSHPDKFSSQDIKDLQVLFNLCWFHPYTIKEDKNLREIIAKGKQYNRDDKEYVIKKQYEIISLIFPLYKELVKQDKIELIVTPYHHPIMPLIYDTDILRDFSYLKKPSLRFSAPEDCSWHLRKAKTIFKEVFGYDVKGSWPSEGSVSEDIISIYKDEGFKWIGADEEILFKSLTTDYVSYDMIKKQRQLIYQPYKFRGVNMFFRDRNLSDTISFIYQGWDDAAFAAADLLAHFKRTHSYIKDISKERAITIIMDGENAWEYYNNNGVDFLEAVYTELNKSGSLETTTPSEFLKSNRSRKLERVASGSWINGDFGVWVGSEKNNFYWNILRRLKDAIEKSEITGAKREQVKKYLYLLEGSDWYWWNTFYDTSGEFKNIFFKYIEKVYVLLGKKVPACINAKR
ncbi:MAG: glycoside hydrolase family 57 protein [Candidatus Omnitrophota bacterium]